MAVGESEPVIGIITALPKEYAAVHAMLDNPVDVSRGGRSRRKYLEGGIPGSDGGTHHVALALLPQMGNNSAAHRATLLLEHFPKVRSLLMVGIAGGAPDPARPDDHVRLGDIVVSGANGIIQYDYVAETPHETMHRHPPRPPSAALLEAVSILEAHELAGRRPWLAHIERASRIRGSERPDAVTDVLLAVPPNTGIVAHPHDPARRPGEPRVFVGAIGSANILVKDPLRRDRMRDKFKIRAFEMEGSGIADATWGLDAGYLAIRGVCDYCDSAKNDTWQNHAAVTAATYMRALLESLPALQQPEPGVEPKQQQDTQKFVEQAAALFRMMHFEVQRGRDFAGRQAPLFLIGTLGDVTVHRVVECLPFGGTVADIDRFAATLRHVRKEYPTATGTLVMGASLTPELAEQVQADGITLATLERLNAQLFDGRAYAMQLAQTLKADSRYRPSVYIEPTIVVDESGGPQPALEVLEDWLADPTWSQLTLLGDVGTGKTFLTHMLSLKLAEAYIAAPASHPLPVLVDLRNADRQLSLEGLISTHLQQRGLERLTFSQFQHALSSGRIVLLLDGFDEMAARVTPQVTARNFNELVKCVQGNAKVLLTCRTHYFVDRSDEEQVVYGTPREYDSEAARELYWDLIARRGFRVAYLRPFEAAQIEEYVRRVRPADANAAISKIREIYDLMELSQRPMLLEMIVSSIDRLHGDTVNAATLYQVFTDVWIQRDRWRDVLPPETKHALVTSLALRLWTSGVEQLHHRELAAHIAERVGAANDPRELVEIDSELRTASFLVRNAGGEYRFAHKSYAEFYVAGHLARSLEAGQIECLSMLRRFGREHLSFFVDMVKKVEQVDTLLAAIVTNDYVANVSENALLCLFALRRDVTRRTRSVQTQIKLPDGMCLNGAVLEGAYLVNAIMHRVKLISAQLYGSDLRDCDLADADLSHADLRSSSLEGARLTGAHCEYANFTDANLTNAQLGSSELTSALIGGAILVGTGLDNGETESTLIRRWYPAVMASAQWWTGDSDQAADIVQQVVLQLILGWRSRKLTKITRSYVLSMVRYQVLDQRRSSRRNGTLDGGDTVRELIDSIPSEEMSPEERLVSEELRVELLRALEGLNPEHANMLRLWSSGLTNREIASAYGISEKNVLQHRNKALELLGRALSAQSVGSS